MNFESDKDCVADYGVFSDNACFCSSCLPKITVRDYRPSGDRIRKDRAAKVSSDFNSHMIYLYNNK